jgi:hypothetical protein
MTEILNDYLLISVFFSRLQRIQIVNWLSDLSLHSHPVTLTLTILQTAVTCLRFLRLES